MSSGAAIASAVREMLLRLSTRHLQLGSASTVLLATSTFCFYLGRASRRRHAAPSRELEAIERLAVAVETLNATVKAISGALTTELGSLRSTVVDAALAQNVLFARIATGAPTAAGPPLAAAAADEEPSPSHDALGAIAAAQAAYTQEMAAAAEAAAALPAPFLWEAVPVANAAAQPSAAATDVDDDVGGDDEYWSSSICGADTLDEQLLAETAWADAARLDVRGCGSRVTSRPSSTPPSASETHATFASPRPTLTTPKPATYTALHRSRGGTPVVAVELGPAAAAPSSRASSRASSQGKPRPPRS